MSLGDLSPIGGHECPRFGKQKCYQLFCGGIMEAHKTDGWGNGAISSGDVETKAIYWTREL
jgi:hypothetical protein